MASQDPSFPDPAAFDAALREAVTHHVLAAEDGEWIAFRHALLAEAVYADLLPGELANLHRAYLRQLTADPSLGSQAEMAHHALRSHDLPAALTASHAAAQEAADVLAPVEELRHLETVLQLWDAVPDADEPVGPGPDRRGHGRRGAASRAGQPARAVALARSAMAQADPVRAARLTPAAAPTSSTRTSREEAVRLARRALEVLDAQGPSPDRARLLAAHARSALNSDLDDEARVTAERAVAESRLLGVPTPRPTR